MKPIYAVSTIYKTVSLFLCVSFYGFTAPRTLAQSTVYLNRIETNDSIPNVIIYQDSMFPDNGFNANTNTVSAATYQAGKNKFKFKMDAPQVLGISGRYGMIHHIYVTPGDSINYVVRPLPAPPGRDTFYTIEFFGKNAAHYNYEFLWRKEFKVGHFFNKGDDILAYKKIRMDWYHQRMDFLAHYKKKYRVSDGFIKWAEADIQNEYVFLLYLPLKNDDISFSDIPTEYFDHTEIAPNPSSYYRTSAAESALLFYNNDIFNSFDKVYKDLLQNYTGEQRSYLLSVMLGIYADKRGLHYRDEFLQACRDASNYVQDSIYLDYIERGKQYYLKIQSADLLDSILNHTYLRSFNNDTKISFKELLENYKGKALYIDFWASWCGPCRQDIANSKEAKKLLSGTNIVYLYISIDKEVEAWIKIATEDNITDNQYLLCDVAKSPLSKFVDLRYIPQYILLDKDHKIKDLDAPKPTAAFFEKLKTMMAK